MAKNYENGNPPVIMHIGRRPENWAEMVADMAANTRLGERGQKLMLYYAGRSNGFRPSLAEIARRTGIAENKISEIRRQLTERAVISYTAHGKVEINWRTIEILAGLPEPLPMRGGNYRFQAAERHGGGEVRMGDLMRRYRIPGGERRDPFFDYIKRLTVDEYDQFSRSVLSLQI